MPCSRLLARNARCCHCRRAGWAAARHEMPPIGLPPLTPLRCHPARPPLASSSPLPPCPSPLCSIIRESAWQLELKGDVTRQRRLEAVDKLMSVLTLVVASVFGVQALGLDVNSGGCWLARAHLHRSMFEGWCVRALGLDVNLGGRRVCCLSRLAVACLARPGCQRGWPLLCGVLRSRAGPPARPAGPRAVARVTRLGRPTAGDPASLPAPQCWPLAAWAAWRWVWRAARSWRTCSRASSSSPPTPLRCGAAAPAGGCAPPREARARAQRAGGGGGGPAAAAAQPPRCVRRRAAAPGCSASGVLRPARVPPFARFPFLPAARWATRCCSGPAAGRWWRGS